MALRGDDFIGVAYDPNDELWLLKGEAKSNQILSKTTIAAAREALCRHDGRCTPELVTVRGQSAPGERQRR